MKRGKTLKASTKKISQQPENCENRNDPDLVQAFLKKWWVESDFKAEFLQNLVKDNKIHEARASNFTYRYIDDVLYINNSRFA
jgi:hypothetical protein